MGRIIQQHVQMPPPSLRQFRPDAPPALDAVLQKALAKDPNARFQSADDMLAAIRRIADGDSSAPPSGTPAPRTTADRRLVYVMGGVALLAIIALVLVLLLR
jgi:serine/threonine-protein kinase